ncbi:MAG: CvpA family protein [Bacillota bacterium]|jgi:uncharacterized membrane protein required for colicin V production
MLPAVETSSAFNWLDWALLIILALSVLSGLVKGLVKQALDFVSLFAGLYLADRWSPQVSVWLNSSFNLGTGLRSLLIPVFGNYDLEPLALAVLSFLLVWGLVSIAFSLLGGILQSVARLPLLNTANRLMGGALGLLKGVVVVFIIASLLSFLPVGSSLGRTAANSYLVAEVQRLSPVFYQQLQALLNQIVQARLR